MPHLLSRERQILGILVDENIDGESRSGADWFMEFRVRVRQAPDLPFRLWQRCSLVCGILHLRQG